MGREKRNGRTGRGRMVALCFAVVVSVVIVVAVVMKIKAHVN